MTLNGLSDFEFYLKFTKPLVLNLPLTEDRILASAWVKKLIEDKITSDEIKIDCLKLFLLILQRRKLYGPFSYHPANFQSLENFPVSINDPKFQQYENMREQSVQPYNYDFSSDLLEYIAFQKIDNFGVHCYYAFSNEPILNWNCNDHLDFPKQSPIRVESVKKSPSTEVKEHEMEKKKKDFAEKLGKKVKTERKVITAAPLGKPMPVDIDRVPPSWGSNLIRVQDPAL